MNKPKEIRSFIKNKKLVEERRGKIFRGAASIFLKKGYGGTSMQELAQYLHMSKYQLYQYIGSKEDVILLIVEYSGKYEHELLSQISNKINHTRPTQLLWDAIRAYTTGVDENQDIHNFNNHVAASMPAEIRQEMFKGYKYLVDTFEKIIQAGIKSGDFREVNANLVAQDLILAMQAWAYRRWLLRKNFTLGKYISEQIEIMRKLLTKEQ